MSQWFVSPTASRDLDAFWGAEYRGLRAVASGV